MTGAQLTMTDSSSELTYFFTSLTRNFTLFEVNSDIQAIVARSFLSKKAKLLLEGLPIEETDTFDKLQTALLALLFSVNLIAALRCVFLVAFFFIAFVAGSCSTLFGLVMLDISELVFFGYVLKFCCEFF